QGALSGRMPPHQNVASFAATKINIRSHFIAMPRGNKRTHLHIRRVGQPDADGAAALDKLFEETCVNAFLHKQTRPRNAALASRSKDARHNASHSVIKIRIIENNMRRLP